MASVGAVFGKFNFLPDEAKRPQGKQLFFKKATNLFILGTGVTYIIAELAATVFFKRVAHTLGPVLTDYAIALLKIHLAASAICASLAVTSYVFYKHFTPPPAVKKIVSFEKKV